ncbi:MAG: hypothetical protein D6812_12475, partial [Deltaproteobacteria bacterium]
MRRRPLPTNRMGKTNHRRPPKGETSGGGGKAAHPQRLRKLDEVHIMSEKQGQVDRFLKKEYLYGFSTDLDTETAPPGLNEEIITFISQKKKEPRFLLDFRLKSYRAWRKMEEPHWAHVVYPPIDYQA